MRTLYGEDGIVLSGEDSVPCIDPLSGNKKDDKLSAQFLDNASSGNQKQVLSKFKKSLIFAESPSQVKCVLLELLAFVI